MVADLRARTLVEAAAAERAMAIVDITAKKGSRDRAQTVLDALWQAGVDGDRSRASALVQLLERIPETRIDDSYKLGFYAGEALEVLATAASNLVPADGKFAGDVLEAARSVFSSYDGPPVGTTQVVDPRNPPPPGAFEILERERQRRDIEVAQSGLEAQELAQRLRDEATSIRARLAPELEPFHTAWTTR